MRSGVTTPVARGPALALGSIVFIDILGYALILPLLPFAAQSGGAAPWAIGLLFASYSGCQLIAAPLLGRLSDHFGRRPVLLLSLLGSLVGYGVMVVSQSVPALLLSRLVDGASAGNIAVVYAMLMDRTTRADLGHRLATLNIAVGLGTLIGLALGAIVAPRGIALAAFAAAALTLGNIAFVIAVREGGEPHTQPSPSPPNTPPARGSVTRRRAWHVALLGAVAQSGFLLVMPFYIVTVHGGSVAAAVGLVAAIVAVAAAAQILLVPMISRRATPPRVAALGFALLIVAGAGATTARSLPAIALVALLGLLGAVTLLPATTALLGSTANDGDEGHVMGLNSSAAAAGQLIGPPLGYAALGTGGAVGFGICCSAIALTGLLSTVRVR